MVRTSCYREFPDLLFRRSENLRYLSISGNRGRDAGWMGKSYAKLVLLCYEPHLEFCHRHIVAAWLELSLGVTVDEIQRIKSDGAWKEIAVERPAYIKPYLAEISSKK